MLKTWEVFGVVKWDLSRTTNVIRWSEPSGGAGWQIEWNVLTRLVTDSSVRHFEHPLPFIVCRCNGYYTPPNTVFRTWRRYVLRTKHIYNFLNYKVSESICISNTLRYQKPKNVFMEGLYFHVFYIFKYIIYTANNFFTIKCQWNYLPFQYSPISKTKEYRHGSNYFIILF